MRAVIILCLPLLSLIQGGEGAKFDPEASARLIAPFLDEQTMIVIRADLSRLGTDAFVEMLIEQGKNREESEERRQAMRRWLKGFTAAGGKEIYLIYGIDELPDMPTVIAPLVGKADPEKLRLLLAESELLPHRSYNRQGNFLVGAGAPAARRLARKEPVPRPEVARAFAAAGDGALQVAVVPSADHRRVIEELLPTIPPEWGGGSGAVLARGIVSATVALRTAPKFSAAVTVQSRDAESAREFQAWLVGALRVLPKNKDAQKLLPGLDKIAASLKPEVSGDRVTMAMDEAQVTTAVRSLFGQSVLSATRDHSLNNLKMMALAMHNYVSTHGHFTAFASHDKQGRPLLSWRVHMLPYVDEGNLYREFKLDEPWDSPHNKKLIEKMPKIYQSPLARLKEPGKTTYMVPRGKETVFPGAEGIPIKDITDGTSNTILVVEAAPGSAVTWTKPDDLPVDSKDPAKGLFVKGRVEVLTVFADGATHAIPATVAPKTLWALFTRNGGEVVDFP